MNRSHNLVKVSAAVLLVGLMALPVSASAHELENTSGISAVLHLVPNDKPVTNVITRYEFIFQDKENQLDVRNCDCKVRVLNGSKVIQTQALKATNALSGSGSVVFPEAGEYDLQIIGSPKVSGAFDNFELSYDASVASKPAFVPTALVVALSAFGGAVLLGVVLLVTRARVKSSSPKSNR